MGKWFLFVLIISAILLFGCTGGQAAPQQPGAQNTGQGAMPPAPPDSGQPGNGAIPQPPQPAGAPSAQARVDIGGFAFSPAEITVPAGTVVTWSNSDPVAHTATSTSGIFNSGNIPAGSSWSYQFNSSGTYDYYCTIHPGMRGKVIVN
ncbi:MAG: plastocyanin/azurin family copper-binding protein [Candidatus Micrarchaeia archaeon]